MGNYVKAKVNGVDMTSVTFNDTDHNILIFNDEVLFVKSVGSISYSGTATDSSTSNISFYGSPKSIYSHYAVVTINRISSYNPDALTGSIPFNSELFYGDVITITIQPYVYLGTGSNYITECRLNGTSVTSRPMGMSSYSYTNNSEGLVLSNIKVTGTIALWLGLRSLLASHWSCTSSVWRSAPNGNITSATINISNNGDVAAIDGTNPKVAAFIDYKHLNDNFYTSRATMTFSGGNTYTYIANNGSQFTSTFNASEISGSYKRTILSIAIKGHTITVTKNSIDSVNGMSQA